MSDIKERFAADGFVVVPNVLSDGCCNRYCDLVQAAISENRNGCVSNSSSTFGVRNLTDAIPEVTELFQEKELRDLLEQLIGPEAFMVRATLFDKTSSANWGVFWHQDLAIAVQQRQQVQGFDGWTKKAGVVCCQPPSEVMNHIVAVRLHLDDCPRDNGALKVLRGSHNQGRIAETTMNEVQLGFEEVTCEVQRGGAIAMNPLTLHASSPKTRDGHRRVIHFEFTAQALPDPLKWSYRIPVKSLTELS